MSSSNPLISAPKDQLIQDMLSLSQQSNFSLVLQQNLRQVLQCRSLLPYLYLHKKTSLKSKFDNTKPSMYLCQLAMYLTSANPLLMSKQIITNKLMSLCIEKFNHLKIKKFQTNQFINFLLVDLTQKQKQDFIHLLNQQKMDNDNISVMMFANVMYWTIVYLWTIKEINQLTNKIKVCVGTSGTTSGSQTDALITVDVLTDYLAMVDEEDSMLKVLDIQEIKHGQSLQGKVVDRIFELFDGEKLQVSNTNKN